MRPLLVTLAILLAGCAKRENCVVMMTGSGQSPTGINLIAKGGKTIYKCDDRIVVR